MRASAPGRAASPGWPAPRANDHLAGQGDGERALLDAYAAGRLPHAWLITGERGIGKATLAFRFARFLLAAEPRAGPGEGAGPALFAFDAAGDSEAGGLFVDPDSPVFRRVASGGHADLITIERRADDKSGRLRSEIVVEDVRAVAPFLAHTAAEGGWRVAVIDGADEMNRNAANALLKALEEPPDRSLLLLVCHNPGRLLPTIRSRCRRLALRPLPRSTVETLLARYRPDLAPAEAAELAGLAGGSIGRALMLAEHDGLALHAEVARLFAALPELDAAALDALGDRVAKGGADPVFPLAVAFLRGWLMRIVRFAATGGGPGEPAADRAVVERLARAAGLDRWLEVWEKVHSLLARVDSANLDRKQVLFDLFFSLERAARS